MLRAVRRARVGGSASPVAPRPEGHPDPTDPPRRLLGFGGQPFFPQMLERAERGDPLEPFMRTGAPDVEGHGVRAVMEWNHRLNALPAGQPRHHVDPLDVGRLAGIQYDCLGALRRCNALRHRTAFWRENLEWIIAKVKVIHYWIPLVGSRADQLERQRVCCLRLRQVRQLGWQAMSQ